MPTIQEYLSQSGSSESKEGMITTQKMIVVGKELPVYPVSIGILRSDLKGSEHINDMGIANNLAKVDTFGGSFIYPIWAIFGENITNRVGKDEIKISESVSVPYLPFLSVIGKVSDVERNKDGWIYLDLPMRSGNYRIAIGEDNRKEIHHMANEIQTANYSQDDFDKSDYLKELYPRGYSYYKVTRRDYSGSNTALFRQSTQFERKNVLPNDIDGLKGKTIMAGIDTARDYFFCDYDFEIGPYTWQSAWVTDSGVPIMDAIFVKDDTK